MEGESRRLGRGRMVSCSHMEGVGAAVGGVGAHVGLDMLKMGISFQNALDTCS